jgi:transcriptional adapter 3
VAARLRTLQHELRRVSRINNVRKARVLELTEERMAMQEYANIADDLDNQVNAAYLKRNRTLSKTPSHKKGGSHQSRPGQAKGLAGAGGFGARGVSDGVRALMQKRRDWIEMVGPVVSFGRPPIPGDGETVFDEGNLRRLERVERDMEAEAGEGDAEGE